MPKILMAALAAGACLCASGAYAQANAGAAAAANDEAAAQQQRHEARSDKVDSTGRDKAAKADADMAKRCKAMPKDRMAADKSCQDYMTAHPDGTKPPK